MTLYLYLILFQTKDPKNLNWLIPGMKIGVTVKKVCHLTKQMLLPLFRL